MPLHCRTWMMITRLCTPQNYRSHGMFRMTMVACKLTTSCDMVCYIILATTWFVLDCGSNHSIMLCHCFIWSWITWRSDNDIMLGVFAGSISHNGLGQGLEKKMQNKWSWTRVMKHGQLRFCCRLNMATTRRHRDIIIHSWLGFAVWTWTAWLVAFRICTALKHQFAVTETFELSAFT